MKKNNFPVIEVLLATSLVLGGIGVLNKDLEKKIEQNNKTSSKIENPFIDKYKCEIKGNYVDLIPQDFGYKNIKELMENSGIIDPDTGRIITISKVPCPKYENKSQSPTIPKNMDWREVANSY